MESPSAILLLFNKKPILERFSFDIMIPFVCYSVLYDSTEKKICHEKKQVVIDKRIFVHYNEQEMRIIV